MARLCYVCAACAVCVTVFSSGGKLWPISKFTELHALTQGTCFLCALDLKFVPYLFLPSFFSLSTWRRKGLEVNTTATYSIYLVGAQCHSQVLSASHHNQLHVHVLRQYTGHLPVVLSVCSMCSCVQSHFGVCWHCHSHTSPLAQICWQSKHQLFHSCSV